MNRDAYMKRLGHNLRRLPKEDYDKAMAYFEEYFEEAGPQYEEAAIEDLGTPEIAASQIIQDIASQNAAEDSKSVKRGISKIWVGILAVFAAPIALPLGFAMVMLLFALLLIVGSLLFAAVITMAAFGLASIPTIIAGIFLLITAPADGIVTIGTGLIVCGASVWIVRGCSWFCKWLINKTNQFIGTFVAFVKRGGQHAK